MIKPGDRDSPRGPGPDRRPGDRPLLHLTVLGSGESDTPVRRIRQRGDRPARLKQGELALITL